MWPKNPIYDIRSIADRSRRYSERHFKVFGAIAVFLIPLSTWVEQAVGNPSFETFYVRVAAAAGGLLLLFHDRLPTVLKNNMELVWIGVVTFVLPFCFGEILTLNAAFATPGDSPSPIWVYQYLVALFIFIQLIGHGPLSVGLWALSSVLVLSTLFLLGSPNWSALLDVWLYPLPVYLTALFIGSITNRNVHAVQAEQLRAASAIGSNIAHELRTPLASIRGLAHGIDKFVPVLVDGYERAKTLGATLQPVGRIQLRELRAGLRTIQQEVEHANTVIDMLLINTSERQINSQAYSKFSISDVVQESVARFPFNNSDERNLVLCNLEDNFEVRASRQLVVHVIFNLLKNALFHAQKVSGGRVSIVAKRHAGSNIVEITDTGPGVPKSLQSRIFDRFFSTIRYGQGAGIGLSFCKMVMDGIGGQIECESQEGEYTTFRLTFPPVTGEGTRDRRSLPAPANAEADSD